MLLSMNCIEIINNTRINDRNCFFFIHNIQFILSGNNTITTTKTTKALMAIWSNIGQMASV